MRNLKVIYSTFKLQLVQSFSRATFRFCIILQPLIYTFILYMMYSGSFRTNYANYVIMGSGLTTLWSAICFSSAGDIERERYMGTLENLFCCPTKFTHIILGKIISNTVMGLTGMILSLFFTKIFFNETLHIKCILPFVVGFLLMIFSFVCISMIISPLFTLSRNARILMNCMECPVFILCGFVFPIDYIPFFLRPLSYVLSPTWSIKILQESLNGITNYNEFYLNILILCLICVVYIIISKILFTKIDKYTRIKASLEVV